MSENLESLEEKVTDEEIALSRRLYNKQKLILKLTIPLTSITTFSWILSDPYFPEPYFSAAHVLVLSCLFARSMTLPINFVSFKSLRALVQGMYSGLRFLGNRSLEERFQQENKPLVQFHEGLIPYTKDPILKRRFYCSLALLQKDYEVAFRRAIPLLAAHEKSPTNVSKKFMETTTRHFSNKVVGKKHLLWHLHYGLQYLATGTYSLAEKHLSLAADLPGEFQAQADCFFNYCLELLSKVRSSHSEESKPNWARTVDILLKDLNHTKQFRRIGESRNEVLQIGGEGILHDTFIFKKNKSPAYLEKEHALSQWLYALCKGGTLVVQPLAYTSYNDSALYVSRRLKGKSLAEALRQETASASLLQKAIDTLYQFQTIVAAAQKSLPPNLVTERDYPRFLKEKFIDRVTSDTTKQQEIINNTSFLVNLLSQHKKTVIHGDFHPENIYRGDTTMTILDPEHMTLAASTFDLVDLLESPFYIMDSQLLQQLTQYAHARCASQASHEQWFFSSYLPVAAYRNIHRIGAVLASSSALNPDEFKRRKNFFRQNATNSLTQLRSGNRQLYDSCRRLEDVLAIV